MDRDELLARAKHYRELADRVTDEQTRRGLLDLAERYEALAHGDGESNDVPPGP